MSASQASHGLALVGRFLYSGSMLPVPARQGMLPADYLFQWLFVSRS
jgi:hypothetical protein